MKNYGRHFHSNCFLLNSFRLNVKPNTFIHSLGILREVVATRISTACVTHSRFKSSPGIFFFFLVCREKVGVVCWKHNKRRPSIQNVGSGRWVNFHVTSECVLMTDRIDLYTPDLKGKKKIHLLNWMKWFVVSNLTLRVLVLVNFNILF